MVFGNAVGGDERERVGGGRVNTDRPAVGEHSTKKKTNRERGREDRGERKEKQEKKRGIREREGEKEERQPLRKSGEREGNKCHPPTFSHSHSPQEQE